MVPINDTCRLITGELKRLFRLPRREGIAGRQVAEGNWAMLAKIEPKPAGSQGEQAKEKAKPMTTKAQTWKDLSVTKRIISAHRKDKNGDIKRLGGPKGHMFGGSPSS